MREDAVKSRIHQIVLNFLLLKGKSFGAIEVDKRHIRLHYAGHDFKKLASYPTGCIPATQCQTC